MATDTPRTLPPNTFLAEASLPERLPTGRPALLPDGAQKMRTIGNFVFRVPTLRERIDIGLARTRLLQGVSPASVGGDTLYFAEALGALPRVIVEGPEGWKTEDEIAAQRDEEEVQAVYRAYVDGLDRFLAVPRSGSQAARA
jgi:hypothetical protein